jgi:hypothetical protein
VPMVGGVYIGMFEIVLAIVDEVHKYRSFIFCLIWNLRRTYQHNGFCIKILLQHLCLTHYCLEPWNLTHVEGARSITPHKCINYLIHDHDLVILKDIMNFFLLWGYFLIWCVVSYKDM